MRTKLQLPPYTLSQIEARSWFPQVSQYGFLISDKRSSKQPPPQFPYPTPPGTGAVKAATLNRLWHDFMFSFWTQQLTPTQRAAWKTEAEDWTITNHRGVNKIPTGYQLFIWWQSYLHQSGWRSPFADAYTSIVVTDPPDHTWPKPTITTPALLTTTGYFIYISFGCDQDATQMDAWLQITKPAIPGNAAPKWAYSRLHATLVYTTNATFNPDYTPGTIVPPWTITPTGFDATTWTVADPTHITGSPATGQIIRAGISAAKYDFSQNLALPLMNSPTKCMIWDLDPSTGAHRALLGIWNEPPPTGPWPPSTVQYQVNQCTSWSDTGTPILGPIDAYPTIYYQYRNWDLTRTAASEILTSPLTSHTLTTLSPGTPFDCGLYGITTGVSYGPTSISYPLPGYFAYFWYPGALESPLLPGTRHARLALGSKKGLGIQHAPWVQFTLTT